MSIDIPLNFFFTRINEAADIGESFEVLAVDGDDDPRCLPGKVLAVAGDACARCLPNFPHLIGVVGDAALFFVLEGFTMFEGLVLRRRVTCCNKIEHPKDLCAQ